jgi:hypothetical protein
MNTLNFLDANVWLALLWNRHLHSETARLWFENASQEEFFFCRFTQMTVLRLLTTDKIMGSDTKTMAEAFPERIALCVHTGVHSCGGGFMAALKVGVREFRERIASFLESDTPVAVTRRGETLGVYIPTPRRKRNAAERSELKAAADRLAEVLADVDEEELVAEFKQMRRRGKAAMR